MDSMKQFIEKRKKTIQEETAKFRVEYEAVTRYLNSTLQKAEANCRELTDESDYDHFRQKCVPSLNWLQEQYDVLLLMHSLCLPTGSELESKSGCCPELTMANQDSPTEMLLVANKGCPSEVWTMANEAKPTGMLPVANEDMQTEGLTLAKKDNEAKPIGMLPVVNEERPLVVKKDNEAKPIGMLPVANEERPSVVLTVVKKDNEAKPIGMLPVANEERPTEVLTLLKKDNEAKPIGMLPVANEERPTVVLTLVKKDNDAKPIGMLSVTNEDWPTEVLTLADEAKPTGMLPVAIANESRPTERLPVTNESKPRASILPNANEGRPKEILPMANQSYPTNLKEHGGEERIYESALSDPSTLREKARSVSSPQVSGPNLSVYVVSHAPDTTTVPSSARSTSGLVVSSSSVSESGKTKRSLEMTSSIPKYRICGTTLDVMATVIISPYLIWVQVRPRASELEDLLEDLTTYHSKLRREDPDYRLHSKPRVGQLVSAHFTQDDMWYRAYVLAVFELPTKSGLPGKKRLELDVGYVDYGNTERLPLSRVRPLPEKFRKLPFQAFVCSLSEIGPAEPTAVQMWSDAVISDFSQMDCTQLLTVRFSKPLPNCPIMFIDVLNSKHVGSSKDGRVSTENVLTEKLILAGQAVRLQDNSHVAKWYSETQSTATQPVNPGEKMVASLTHADSHYAHMPILDDHLFETLVDVRGARTRPSFPNNDRGQRHPNQYQLPSMPSANSGHPWLTKRQSDSSQTLDNSRPSFNGCQPLLPKPDTLQQSLNDVQVESQRKVDVGQPPMNRGRASIQHHVDLTQSVLNVLCPVFEFKGSNSESQQRLDTVSSNCNNDSWRSSHHGAAEVSTSGDHSKGLCQSQTKAVSSSSGMVVDIGQQKLYDQDQVTSSGAFTSTGQSSAISSTLREFSSSKDGLESSEQMDSVAGSRRRVIRKGSRNSFQHAVEGVPRSLDGQNYNGSTMFQPPSSSCSLRDQKFNETKTYVETLASSGWPDRIAAEAMRHCEDELSNASHEDLVISPSSDSVKISPLKSEADVLAKNADVLDEDLKQDWLQEFEQEQAQSMKQNLAHRPVHAETKQAGHELFEQEVTNMVSHVVVPNEGFIRVVMSHLESPSRFWVHLIDENACLIDYIGNELKKNYVDATSLDDTWITEALKYDRVFHDYGICCACSSVDCEFYRAEVISDCRNEKLEIKVKVFYIDFGNYEWIDASQMLPLPPNLLSIPPLAVRCSLDGLEPVPASDESVCHWSQVAIDVFTDLCGFTRELHGHFPSQVKPGDTFYVSRDRPLRLRLEVLNGDVSEDINQQLVSLGLARPARQRQPTEDRVIPPEKEEPRDEMENWDPMAEDFLSHRNSYKVDIDDPGVATVNYKAQDERRICRFFHSKNSQCWKGDDCPYEHISYRGVVTTTDRREVFSVCDDELQLERPPVGSWVVVSVTCMVDPSHFYVVLPFGTKSPTEALFEDKKPMSSSQHDEGYDDRIPSPSSNRHESLEYLMDRLQECYRSKVYVDTDLTVYAEGEIVIVRFTQDERWHRAKIVTSDPDNNRVQVLYLDFGNKEWVDNERVRQIEMQFLYLPFQAVECRLPLCANNASGKIWSDIAKKLFLDLTRGKFLVARVVQRGAGGLLYLELYNTRDGDVNINKTLMEKGYARNPDRLLIPRSQDHRTPSPKRGRGSTWKDCWVLLPG